MIRVLFDVEMKGLWQYYDSTFTIVLIYSLYMGFGYQVLLYSGAMGNVSESALESAFLGFGDMEIYPTIEEKAAKIGFSLVSNHAFVDGNKRIGVFVMLVFLEANGIRLDCTDEELVSVALSLAKSEYGYEDLLNWILKH